MKNNTLYDFKINRLDDSETSLQEFKGKVMLIVNTASQCGFTPQYAGLEQLYQTYGKQGLVVLGFPCNQFGAQEPGNANEIADFCETQFHVSFPMFAKIEVNGTNAHPLYSFLKAKAKGLLGTDAIKWNFTKFLLDRQGNAIARYAPMTKPQTLETEIKRLLNNK